mgnify:CR=1 FL=1
MRIAKLILSTLLTLFILGCVAVGIVYVQFKSELPDVESLKTVELQQPMQIYTSDGKLIGEVGEQRRIPVKLENIPEKLIQAVLATEDSRFYEHHGLDPIGIARAIFVAINNGGASQGASTITQQLARNFFLTSEKTFTRKAKEAILAIEIENALNKQEILELYLNKIYLGYRSYGVAAAAKTYFGKELNQLTLSEMAVIAGLPKAPSTMNPLSSPKRALERRNVVLWRMLDQKYITQQEYDAALKEPIVASYHGAKLDFRADYVTEMVRQEMVKRFGEENAYTKGYQVYTTVLSNDQEVAQKAVRDNLIAYDMRHGYRGGAPLWKKGETPWDNDTIIGFLKKLPNSEPFIPAAVISVSDHVGAFKSQEWAEKVHADVKRICPYLDEPEAARVITEKRATTACMPDSATPDFAWLHQRRIYPAGDYLHPRYPATLEAGVQSGLTAAEMCLAEINLKQRDRDTQPLL